MEFETGDYVVLKSEYSSPYSEKVLVEQYGIIPEKTIGLINREDKYTNGFLASVYWRLSNGEIKYLDVAINDIKLTTPPKDPIEIPKARSVFVNQDLISQYDPPPNIIPGGGKKARRSRKSCKSYKKYRKSRKARKSRRARR
jgi:hypothetical protein